MSCAYCQCSLGGWEKADDPVKEHQKRKPDCAVFISEVEKVEKKQESDNRTVSSSTAKARSVSRKRGVAEATEIADEEEVSSSRAAKKRTSIVKEKKDKVEEDTMEEAKDEDVKAAKSKEEEVKPATKKRKKAVSSKAKAAVKKTILPSEEPIESTSEEPPSKAKVKKGSKKTLTKKAKAVQKEDEQKEEKKMELDAKEVVEVSDFEEEPSRSHSRESEAAVTKGALDRADSPPTSCESETFKTPKQTTSGRTTGVEKTPKPTSTSPIVQTTTHFPVAASSTAATTTIQGDVPLLTKLDTLTSRERTMTVEDYLKSHVGKACSEMEAEGNKRIANLKSEMDRGRSKAERILRGIDINPAEV